MKSAGKICRAQRDVKLIFVLFVVSHLLERAQGAPREFAFEVCVALVACY